MSNESKNKLTDDFVELAVQFKEAAEARLEEDADLQARAIASLKPEEMEELQSLAMELATGALSAMLSSDVDEDFLKLNLKVVNIVEELSERVMDKSVLANYLPEGLVNQEAIDTLRANDADNLASLCEYKLSLKP